MNDPQTDTIDLEHKNIADLRPFLGMLSKFSHLDNLILRSNKLTSIPEKINQLKLTKLDISENDIENLAEACKTLSTLPNLKSLFIDINDDDDVEIVIQNLPNLEYLNSESLADLDNDNQSTPDNDVNFEMQQSDLEEISNL